ncbi:hypothetical protein EDD15DRAFT_1725027 [Pisolithus albus]|nr:hypothetical protein EDD15DRAFT_1725027 [Pisolithus albus]
MGRQNETTIHEKRCKQNQKRDKNRPSTHHPSHTYDGALSPTIIYRSYYMAPLPNVESGEVQTTTIIGIVLGLGEYLCCQDGCKFVMRMPEPYRDARFASLLYWLDRLNLDDLILLPKTEANDVVRAYLPCVAVVSRGLISWSIQGEPPT